MKKQLLKSKAFQRFQELLLKADSKEKIELIANKMRQK